MKHRRALSTVVGGVFFVIAFTSTIGYVSYSMNLLNNLGEAILVKNEEKIDSGREEFEIVKVTRDNNKFNITVQNTGNLPIAFTRLWIENTTDTDDTDRVFKYELNKMVNPGETVSKIGQDLPLTALPTQAYDLKIVTKRGNMQEVSVNSANQAPVYLQLYASPSSIPTKFTTTLLLSVTNNMTNNNMLLDIKPNSAYANSIDKTTNCPIGTCKYTYLSGPEPTSYPILRVGETAYFRWIYQIEGESNDKVTFTASLQNGISLNTASATVTVTEVQSALVSGTALKSQGLTSTNNPQDILIFHQETDSTPQGRYQIHSGDAEQTGLNIKIATTSPKFFTNNGSLPITIPPGVWNASLRYYSAALPASLTAEGEDMIHHFEESGTPDDSGPNNRDLTKCSGGKAPQHNPTLGPNGTGTYYFDGGDCMSRTASNNIDIASEPDTTALWFKHGDGVLPSTKQTLLRWDISGNGDYYEIAIAGPGPNQGKIVFSYDTSSGGGDKSECVGTSNSVVTDQKWHHVVAVRATTNQPPGMVPPATEDDCYLYVDGMLHVAATFILPGSSNVDADTLHIGSNRAENNEFFKGYIDDIIHWNSKALSPTEVFDLYKTSYGIGAHKVNFVLSKTDKNGVFISPTIITSNNYQLKFIDGKQLSDTNDLKYGRSNYTFTLPQVSLDAGNRLNFSMSYASGLDMNLRIDDSSMINPKSTFIQTGGLPNNPFPSYLRHDRDNEVQFFALNSGPNGIWMTYQGTRVVFDSTSGTTSYAGLIHTVNGTNLNENTDSIFIALDQVANMRFYRPQSTPQQPENPSLVIPAGDYNLYVFINGYDDTGRVFLRSVNIGPVKVVP